MSKSYRRYGTGDEYGNHKEFRRNRKDGETKSQKKRAQAALKRGDVSGFYEQDDGYEDFLERREAMEEHEEK